MQNLYVQVEKPQDILRARTRTWNRVLSLAVNSNRRLTASRVAARLAVCLLSPG